MPDQTGESSTQGESSSRGQTDDNPISSVEQWDTISLREAGDTREEGVSNTPRGDGEENWGEVEGETPRRPSDYSASVPQFQKLEGWALTV
jgi:hypothetical protein